MICRQISFSLLAFILLCITGCATYQYGITDVRPVSEYPNRTQVDGISLAVDPYDSTEKAEKGFHVDVTSEGFYPVNLIFKNDTKDHVIVFRDSIVLIDGSGNSRRPVRGANMYNAFENNKIAYAFFGFGILSYMSAEEANRKMETDWRQKEIPEQLVIQPGRKANGFVYFQLPKDQTVKGGKLRVEAESLETRKKNQLELILVSGF